MPAKVYVKSILNRHKKRDSWFLDEYSVNPYYGCGFNCLYCYTKGSRYGGDSPGVVAKINAPQLLRRQLRTRARRGEHDFIAISTSTEAYQQAEEKLKLTRKLLEIVQSYRFPVHILTKSTLVLRDLDVLEKIDEKAIIPEDLKDKLNRGVILNFSFSTLDERISKSLEPGAPTPEDRLKALEKCLQRGFYAGVSFIPVLPYISDTEEQIDAMIKTAAEYGANFVFVGSLTLFGDKPGDCKSLYYRFLEEHYPELIPEYKSLFGDSHQPPMEYQKKLAEKAKKFCEMYGVKMGIV